MIGSDSTDTNGCSVYTLGVTCDMSYADAAKTAEAMFYRQKGKGARNTMIMDAFTAKYNRKGLINGCKVTEIFDNLEARYEQKGRVRLSYFAKTMKGTWYCLINGHAVAVVNGTIVDNMPEGFSDFKFVNWACKVERVVEVE